MQEKSKQNFTSRVENVKSSLNMTDEEVSDFIGISRCMLYLIRSGKANISRKSLKKLSIAEDKVREKIGEIEEKLDKSTTSTSTLTQHPTLSISERKKMCEDYLNLLGVKNKEDIVSPLQRATYHAIETDTLTIPIALHRYLSPEHAALIDAARPELVQISENLKESMQKFVEQMQETANNFKIFVEKLKEQNKREHQDIGQILMKEGKNNDVCNNTERKQ